MLSTLKLQLPSPSLTTNSTGNSVSGDRRLSIRLPQRQLASISIQSENTSSSELLITSHLISNVGSSSKGIQWNLTHRHIHILNFIACTVIASERGLPRAHPKGSGCGFPVISKDEMCNHKNKAAVSATWLFLSAIPTLLAIRRAAESLEKLMDVTREELPDTMAAVRLSGMEISDLTMELSDIGQGLTQGVRSSTRAVRLAEERLRQFSSTTQSATMQGLLVPTGTRTTGPALAKKARDLREGIVKGRSVLQMLFALTGYSRTIFNFFKSRAKP